MKVDSKTGLVQASPQTQPKRRQLSEDTAMSYDEWALCGYYIRSGEKSEMRDILGIPQFTIEQVEKKKPQRSSRRIY